MLDELSVYHYSLPDATPCCVFDSDFILSTCQRTLIITFCNKSDYYSDADLYKNSSAYQLLLEVICGLKSSIIAETEIIKQFKNSYTAYLKNINRDTRIIFLLEQLFKDSKRIRTKYLNGIGGESYASICRYLLRKYDIGNDLLLLGSGQLAHDVTKICSNEFNISICARNIKVQNELEKKYNLKSVEWNNRNDWHNYPVIINTIGDQTVLCDESFFEKWQNVNSNVLFIDLGSPSTIATEKNARHSVWRLSDILEFAKKRAQLNSNKIAVAITEIEKISYYRISYLKSKYRSIKNHLFGEINGQI